MSIKHVPHKSQLLFSQDYTNRNKLKSVSKVKMLLLNKFIHREDLFRIHSILRLQHCLSPLNAHEPPLTIDLGRQIRPIPMNSI